MHPEGNDLETMRGVSDGEGRFVVEDLSAGSVVVAAEAQGFRSATLPGVRLEAGQHMEGLEIVLERGGLEVSGRVLGEEREPVVDARVSLASETSDMHVQTDAEGGFHSRLEAPGVYNLRVFHSTSPQIHRLVELRAGQPLDILLEKGASVSGQVVDSEGRAVAGAGLQLAEALFAGGPSGTSDREGLFTIERVPPGDYRLFVDHPEYAALAHRAPVTVTKEGVSDLLLRLTRGAIIKGQISGLDFDGLSRLMLYAMSRRQAMRTGEVDFEGSYRIPNIGPGHWRVVAQHGNRMATEVVEVLEGAPEVVVDLDFSAGFTVEGRVLRGDLPVAGARLLFQGLDVGARRCGGWAGRCRSGARVPSTRSAQADPQGAYRADGLSAWPFPASSDGSTTPSAGPARTGGERRPRLRCDARRGVAARTGDRRFHRRSAGGGEGHRRSRVRG